MKITDPCSGRQDFCACTWTSRKGVTRLGVFQSWKAPYWIQVENFNRKDGHVTYHIRLACFQKCRWVFFLPTLFKRWVPWKFRVIHVNPTTAILHIPATEDRNAVRERVMIIEGYMSRDRLVYTFDHELFNLFYIYNTNIIIFVKCTSDRKPTRNLFNLHSDTNIFIGQIRINFFLSNFISQF